MPDRFYRGNLAETTIRSVRNIEKLADTANKYIVLETYGRVKELQGAGRLIDTMPSRSPEIPDIHRYELYRPCVVHANSIYTLRHPIKKTLSDIKPIQVTRVVGTIREACEVYPNSIVFCDINPIVVGGGFRFGDESNESLLCYGSTLFSSLASKATHMHFHCTNAGKGRWSQDAVVVVPDITFFMTNNVINDELPLGCRFAPMSEWTHHIFMGIAPPNMTCTSKALKYSTKTRTAMEKRFAALFELSTTLPDDKRIIVPLLGHRTFNVPLDIVADSLVKALARLNTTNITEIILVFDNDIDIAFANTLGKRIGDIREVFDNKLFPKYYI